MSQLTSSPGTNDAAGALPPPGELDRFEQIASIGSLEVDRFCEGCNYNLHGQMVRTDPRTKLLLVRCPECGRFACATDAVLAGKVWMQRIASVMTALWVLVVLWLLVIAFGLICANAMELLRWMNRAAESRIEMERLPIEVGIAVTAQSGPYYGHYDYYAENRTSTIVAHTLGAMAIGLFGAGLFVVLVPHWKRVMYMVGLIAFTLAACIFAGAVWHLDQSVSEREVFPIGDAIAWQGWLFVCTVITGIISIFLARPLARLTIRMLLVPRLRPALGYLWEADGLEPPKPVTKKS